MNSAVDRELQAKEYLEKHRIMELLSQLTSFLLFDRPSKEGSCLHKLSSSAQAKLRRFAPHTLSSPLTPSPASGRVEPCSCSLTRDPTPLPSQT